MSNLIPSGERDRLQGDILQPLLGDELPLNALDYWRSITKRKYSILLLGLALAVLSAVVVFAMSPIYRSTTTVLIEDKSAKVLTIEDVYSGVSSHREHYQTQVEIIKSRDVAIKTIIKTKLWEYPEFDPRSSGVSFLSKIQDFIGYSEQSQSSDEWTDSALAEKIYPRFKAQMSLDPVRLSRLVQISFESRNPQLAATVANAIAEVYIENDLDARYRMTQKANNWLQERLSGLRAKLDASERALQAFREREGIIETKGSAQSGTSRQIDEVTHRLVEARMKRAEVESIYNQIKSVGRGDDLAALPGVMRNQVVAEAKRQEADADRRLAEISQRYAHEHPKYQQAVSEQKTARDNVRRQVDIVVSSITREYEAARGAERVLEGVLGSAKATVQTLNRKEFELGVLERDVQTNREMYDMFMKRTKETNVSGGLQSAVARIVDPGVSPLKPVKPRKQLIIALAFVLGIALGVISSLILDRLDNTLKSSEDVESKLKQPLLTILPLLNKESSREGVAARILLNDPSSVYAESVRTARTGVMLSSIDLNKRILLVTSSVPSEGKTTFSINLALAHAQTQKTLLIDADMRRPSIAKSLGLNFKCKGFSDLVAGTASLDECLQAIEGSSLLSISSGSIPPNPLELLLSERFRETIGQLSERFDLIILDSPPVELVSDSLVIAKYASGVIYVINSGETPYQLARKGIQRIRRADGQILGIVLNRLDFDRAHKYYGEYSGYRQYGYGAKEYKAGYGATGARSET